MSNSWLAVGPEAYWDASLSHGGVWGLRETGRHLKYFDLVSVSDAILFYVTRPISGLVGFGRVGGKEKADSPFWPDERASRQIIWPLRIKFEVECVIPRHMWNSERIQLISVKKKAQGGFQPVLNGVADSIKTQLETVRQRVRTE